MKYIRTKDGIYKWGTFNFVGKNIEKEFFSKPSNTIFQSEVLSESDTLEELVDELVVVEPNNEDCPRPYILDCFYLCTYNSWFEREKEHIKTGTIVVYGSIWVDDELHKVAKMNKEGKLELL